MIDKRLIWSQLLFDKINRRNISIKWNDIIIAIGKEFPNPNQVERIQAIEIVIKEMYKFQK